MNATNIHENGAHKLLFRFLFSITITLITAPTAASRPVGDVDLGGGYITDMGFVAPGDTGQSFTNAEIRTMAVSIGQLGGVNPQTGEIIVNDDNLLPLVSKDLDVTGKAFFYTNIYVAADTYVYGVFYGSGAGITNLPMQNISGSLVMRPEIQSALSTKLDADGVWETINESATTIHGLQSLIAALDASVTDTNNPHRVTALQTGALPVTGGKVTGNIDLNDTARITNLPEPANDKDAVSKIYLDRRLQYIPPQGDISMGIYTNSP